jgi:hypothetical protein
MIYEIKNYKLNFTYYILCVLLYEVFILSEMYDTKNSINILHNVYNVVIQIQDNNIYNYVATLFSNTPHIVEQR